MYPSRFKSANEEQPEEDKGEYESDKNSKDIFDQNTSTYVPTDFAEKATACINSISDYKTHLTSFYH